MSSSLMVFLPACFASLSAFLASSFKNSTHLLRNTSTASFDTGEPVVSFTMRLIALNGNSFAIKVMRFKHI